MVKLWQYPPTCNMKALKYIVGTLLSIIVFHPGFTQIDTTHTADYLVREILLGNGVLVGNVKFTGQKHAIGLYEDPSAQTGITQGIVLTSGNAFYVLGPNKTPRSGWASNAPGDEQLDRIARGKTYDAAVLEFDFVTASENLSFEFVFGSEEYLEYVGSKFNDVFAFFVHGPGVDHQNIAMLPDQATPITVNTVNNQLNKKYYVDNAFTNVTDPFVWDVRNRKVVENKNYLKEEVPPTYNIQFDGFTTVLTAQCQVIPNQVYRIKIAISDVGDGILDSGVFLKGGSFRSYGKEVVKLDDHFGQQQYVRHITKKQPVLNNSTLKEVKLGKELSKVHHLGKVEFHFDKYDLTEASKSVIQEVYTAWKGYKDHTIVISGHTDSFGSDAYNLDLAKNRAQSVATELITLGVPAENLVVKSMGESTPLQDNQTVFGRARNRRVEFLLKP